MHPCLQFVIQPIEPLQRALGRDSDAQFGQNLSAVRVLSLDKPFVLSQIGRPRQVLRVVGY